MEELKHTRRSSRLLELANRWSLALGLFGIGASKFAFLWSAAPDGVLIPVPVLIGIGLLECAIAAWLVLRPSVRAGAVALALGLVFLLGTVALTGSMSELDSCGCFGPWRASAGTHLAVAFVMVLLASSVLLDEARRLRGGSQLATHGA